jgi:hypothetical protein
MNDYIKKEILPLLKEMRSDQIAIKVNVGTLEGKFEQHIREHNE